MATGTRRAPFPYTAVIDDTPVPFMGGSFKGEKVQPFSQITPTSQAYENWPAFKERTSAWSVMLSGFGHSTQIEIDPEKDGFYSYALGCDLSAGTIWQKGPAITWITPTLTGSIAGFEEIVVAGAKKVVAIAGQYALERTGDTGALWPNRQDLGATGYRPEAVTSNATGATPYLIAGITSGGNPWRTADGTTWVQNTGALGRIFKVLPDTRELYAWTGQNDMAKVDLAADWWNIANWSAADNFQVGDGTKAITELTMSSHNALVIVKEDGIFTLRDDGQQLDLYPALHSGSDSNNGRGGWLFGNDTYIPTVTTGLIKLTPSGFYGTVLGAEAVGTEKLNDNSSPVRGRITAGEGTQFNAYAAIYNQDTGNSYIGKYGSRVPVGDKVGTFVPVWHFAISQAIVGEQITAMRRSTVGAPSGHERLYIGTSGGRIGWFVLPCTSNPSNCSAYLFDTTDGFVYLPSAHFGFRTDTKVLEGASVWGIALGGTNYARVGMRTDPSASYIDVGAAFTVAGGSRHDFAKPLAGMLGDIQVTLSNSSQALSPQVNAVAVHHKVQPATVIDYEGVVDGRPGALLRDNRPNRRPPGQTKAALEATLQEPFSTWIMPTEDTVLVSVHEYSFKEYIDPRTKQRGWLMPFKAVAYRTSTPYGTWARIQQNSWGSIQRNTWAQIEVM